MHLFDRNNRIRKIKKIDANVDQHDHSIFGIFIEKYNRIRKSKKNAKANFFQHRRWQLVTLLEEYSGVWPYQSKLKKYSLQIFHFFNFVTIMFVLANQFVQDYIGGNFEMAFVGIVTFLFVLSLTAKLVFSVAFENRRLKIYERIVKHFEIIIVTEEAEVLHEFANYGYKAYTIYMGIIGVLCVLFSCVPNIRVFYHYYYSHDVLNLILPFPMDYSVDHKKYWHFIGLHFLSFVYSAFLINISFDLSFILQVKHVQTLFKIVCMRINKVSKLASKWKNNTRIDNADKCHLLIVSAIDLHTECFELVKMIEENYTVFWFNLMFLNCAYFGAGITMFSWSLHDPVEAFKVICSFIILLMHFQLVFTQGQSIINSSSAISNACYNCKWYDLPMKSRKLLIVIMIRSAMTCQLTGAKLFPLSLEMFTKMLKAGISCYTVFQQ